MQLRNIQRPTPQFHPPRFKWFARPDAGKELAKALATNSTVQNINLETNNLGPDAGKELAKALATNSTVQKIILWGNDFDDETKAAITTAWGDRDASQLKL